MPPAISRQGCLNLLRLSYRSRSHRSTCARWCGHAASFATLCFEAISIAIHRKGKLHILFQPSLWWGTTLTKSFTLIVQMPKLITLQMPERFLYSSCPIKLRVLRIFPHQHVISFFQPIADDELIVPESWEQKQWYCASKWIKEPSLDSFNYAANSSDVIHLLP